MITATDTQEIQEPARPARILGFRRSALLEIILYLGIVLALDLLFSEGDRFAGAWLHPFWIIVLLASVQYGTREGLLAAALSGACLVTGNLPEQDLFQDTYEYVFGICRLPVAWFAVSLVLGELRMRHLREKHRLDQELRETRKRERDISRAYENVSLLKDKLEARVAGQLHSATSIYRAARELEKQEPGQVLEAMADLVRAVMKPEMFSLYLLKENMLEVTLSEGWTRSQSFTRIFTPGSPLFREVIGTQRIVCCASAGDEALLAGEGVLAGPLTDSETGETLGMLKVESLGFFNLNFSNLQSFKVLCEWIATAYGNARRYQVVRSDSVMNAGAPILSYGFFQRHVEHLSALARRLGFDLSMLVVRLENETELPGDKRALIPAALADAAGSVLRKTDLAFEHRRSGYEYAVVLPDTPVVNAQVVADKLLGRLSALLGDKVPARFSCSVHCLNSEKAGVKLYYGDLPATQTDFFMRLARRIGFNLSTIEIRLANSDGMAPETRTAAREAISLVLQKVLPSDEAIVSCISAGCVYHILLFGRSLEEAQRESDLLRDMTEERFSESGLKVRLVITVREIHREQPDWKSQDVREVRCESGELVS